LSPKNKEK